MYELKGTGANSNLYYELRKCWQGKSSMKRLLRSNMVPPCTSLGRLGGGGGWEFG